MICSENVAWLCFFPSCLNKYLVYDFLQGHFFIQICLQSNVVKKRKQQIQQTGCMQPATPVKDDL